VDELEKNTPHPDEFIISFDPSDVNFYSQNSITVDSLSSLNPSLTNNNNNNDFDAIANKFIHIQNSISRLNEEGGKKSKVQKENRILKLINQFPNIYGFIYFFFLYLFLFLNFNLKNFFLLRVFW
jgi:hypothetical protein